MGQASAKHVAFVIYEYLGLVFEAPECTAVNNPISISLEVSAIAWPWFFVQPATAERFGYRVWLECAVCHAARSGRLAYLVQRLFQQTIGKLRGYNTTADCFEEDQSKVAAQNFLVAAHQFTHSGWR